jgi:hypothetical protein
MGLFNKLFSNKQIDSRLIGTWISESKEFEGTKMTFKDNGNLIYEIPENGKIGIIYMKFETIEDFIISNQSSHPKIEKTRYTIAGDLLTLKYEGSIAIYRRKI